MLCQQQLSDAAADILPMLWSGRCDPMLETPPPNKKPRVQATGLGVTATTPGRASSRTQVGAGGSPNTGVGWSVCACVQACVRGGEIFSTMHKHTLSISRCSPVRSVGAGVALHMHRW